MPPRLLCCGSSLDGGGSERQLWMLATGIDPQRFDRRLYLLHRRGVYLDRLPPELPVDAYSDVARPPGRLAPPGWIHRDQVRHLVHVLRSRSIDVVYDRTYHMTLVTAAACAAVSIPRLSVIVSPPSLDFALSAERFAWFKKRLLRRAYRHPLATTIAVSESVADDAARFYRLDRASILTIPSAVDASAIIRAADEALADETPVDGTPSDRSSLRVVVVGRLSEEKGQRWAIEALARAQDKRPDLSIQLDLIGDGPDRSDLERLADELGVASAIRFAGFQVNPYPWIRRADLLCLPSLYEGLPNAVLEAMCLGTPVVASDGAARELTGDGERGELVPPGDAELLARAWIDRATAPDRWLRRADRARDWVIARHDLPRWLDTMQSLIESAILDRSNG